MHDEALKPLAVITGASSGIGYALAEEFAKHGYDLMIAADSDKIFTAAEQLKQFGTNVDAAQAILSPHNSVPAVQDILNRLPLR